MALLLCSTIITAERIKEFFAAQGGKFVQCIKHGVTLRGIDCGPPRRPLHPLNKDDKRELAEVIRTMNKAIALIEGEAS